LKGGVERSVLEKERQSEHLSSVQNVDVRHLSSKSSFLAQSKKFCCFCKSSNNQSIQPSRVIICTLLLLNRSGTTSINQ